MGYFPAFNLILIVLKQKQKQAWNIQESIANRV